MAADGDHILRLDQVSFEATIGIPSATLVTFDLYIHDKGNKPLSKITVQSTQAYCPVASLHDYHYKACPMSSALFTSL